MCPRWSNFFHVYFMEKTKLFIPPLPIILCPLIFLFVFLSLQNFNFFPFTDTVYSLHWSILATLLTNQVKIISWSLNTLLWTRPPNTYDIFSYTDCFRRNSPYLGRKCLRLLYINIHVNKKYLYSNLKSYGYMEAKRCVFLAVPGIVSV